MQLFLNKLLAKVMRRPNILITEVPMFYVLNDNNLRKCFM